MSSNMLRFHKACYCGRRSLFYELAAVSWALCIMELVAREEVRLARLVVHENNGSKHCLCKTPGAGQSSQVLA